VSAGAPLGRSELARRVATAAVALPLLLAGMLWAPPWVGLAIVTVAVAFGWWEFLGLVAARELQPFRATGTLALAATYFQLAVRGWPIALLADVHWHLPLWPLAAFPILIALLARARDFSRDVPAAALTLLGALYLGGFGGTIAALRIMPPDSDGPWRILLLLAAVMAGDTAAYFAGRALGRHKLAPAISPGKTVEGAVAGVLGSALATLGVVSAANLAMPWTHALTVGTLVGIAAIAGDLFESLLKRWAGVKDSGRLFPGHGGMLDRLDSLLFGAAVLYYYFSLSG
jgi:phosphatidate cytidylyltransferase